MFKKTFPISQPCSYNKSDSSTGQHLIYEKATELENGRQRTKRKSKNSEC